MTYHSPNAKTAESPIFRLTDICKCHILFIGTNKMEKSETILMTHVTIKSLSVFKQCPGIVGSQVFRSGMHSKQTIRVCAT